MFVLIAGITFGLLSTIARLATVGFFYPIGLLTVVVFGLLHIRFLKSVFVNFEKLERKQKKFVWTGILIYPLIFLFQFDLEEFKDAFYVYEFLTGHHKSQFEYYAFYIAIFAAVIYGINTVLWNRSVKKIG